MGQIMMITKMNLHGLNKYGYWMSSLNWHGSLIVSDQPDFIPKN